MYQKFWNQFLTEAAENTFDLGKVTIEDPEQQPEQSRVGRKSSADANEPADKTSKNLSGLELFLLNKGFYLDELIGKGADGKVYKATNKKTGQSVAIKTIAASQGGGASAEREVENYKFVKDNYNSLGEYKKYLPVVYEASMEDIPVEGEDMNGIKEKTGFIVMEELEQLPPEVLRTLFATVGDSKRNKRARILRDKRLMKNPHLVSSLLNIAWNLMSQIEEDFLTREAKKAAEKKILEKFFTGKKRNIIDSPPRKKLAMSKEGKRLMSLYIKITYMEMVNHAKSENHREIIESYRKHMLKSLQMSYEKAYAKPLVSGAEGRPLPEKSPLRGMDTFYGKDQEDELENEFPEISLVRKAMKKFASRDFKAFDVHAGNVMMRSGTNDIVIVDLGRFNT
jgi:hypothetical protein